MTIVGREGGAMMVPVLAEPPRGLKLTNGIELPPNVKALIRSIGDIKTAKAVVKLATRQLNKLKAEEEKKACNRFAVGMPVWWTKSKLVKTGTVLKVKSRKLVIQAGGETVTLPVKKVNAGPVPRDTMTPMTAIKKGGGEQVVSAEA